MTAQELRGRITGVVTDASGALLPGVTVTAESPALIRPQTAVTGADGSYRFPPLPSGVYSISFELAGFGKVRHQDVRVVLNQTLAVNAQLQLAGLTETVTISGQSPVVDTSTTTLGTNFTKELLQDIPNARDIWAAIAQAPGFHMTGFDVGGSHTGTQTGFMFYGTAGQNKTLLEGINVTEGQDANAGYFDFGSFEEFQVGAGAMGEQQGPGALMNITIKSGGDRYKAQFYYDFENDKTISDNILSEFKVPGGVGPKGFKAPVIIDPATGERLGLLSGNPIVKQYDFNVNAGGPIVKRRAWFFVSYRDNNQYRSILGLPGESAQSQLKNYTAKGTWQLSQNNKIIAFYNERTKLQPLRDLSLAIPVSAAHWQASKNRPVKVEWTSVLTDRAYLDLQYSHWGNYFPLYPTQTQSTSVEGVPVGRLDLVTQQRSGSMDYYHNRTTLKPQLSGSLTLFKDKWFGSHDFKLGFEAYRERRQFLRFQPFNFYYRDRPAGQQSEIDLYNTPNEGIDDANLLAFFAQDTWALTRRVTLNYGVRYDRYSLGWPAQSFTPELAATFPDLFRPVDTPDTTVAKFNSVSPRVGLAWDVAGNGKTVFKVFYGRYYFNPSTDISSLENPVGQAALRFAFNDQNGNRILDGRHELGNLLSSVGGAGNVLVDRVNDASDPGILKHAYGQGISTHIEREVATSLSARASYVYKSQRNGWAEVDVARVGAYTQAFPFVDIGPDGVTGTGDDQTLSLLNFPATTAQRRFTTPGTIPGVPAFDGDYHTFELALNRRFKDRWLLLTSFEHTWADDFRATGVGTSNLAVARQATGYLWQPNRRQFGRQKTTYWNYKLVGRYVFPYEIGFSTSYKLQSGFNWARTISVGGLRGGSEEILAEPVDSNRTENVHILDFRAEKAFKLRRQGNVTFMFDIFNAVNANPIANFRVATGSRFKEVITLLDPRIFRLGVRYDF
ncbi:MAG TPA: TonB-dependent receptor [Vicinamibacterales bacterium]|nr:TonB-dependent receptor [Vicinamibacterales bacterium]